MTNNLSVEQIVIGTVLRDPSLGYLVEAIIASDFTVQSNQIVWEARSNLTSAGTFSIPALTEYLRSRELLDALGQDVSDVFGIDYINFLMATSDPIGFEYFVAQLGDAAMRRELSMTFHVGQSTIANLSLPATNILDDTEDRLREVRKKRTVAGSDIGSVLEEFERDIDAYRDGTKVFAFKPYLKDVNKIVGYIEDEDFIILSARPGDGKSSYARYEAYRAAMNGKKVVIFNLENSEREYARYLVAMDTGINSMKLKDPKQLDVGELARVRLSVKKFKLLPLKIVTIGGPTVSQIVAIARRLSAEGYEIFFVDYIQLINNNLDNPVENITRSSAALRALCLQIKKPIIALSQFNRDIAKRGEEAKPRLDDLRGSGSLEQDATQVWSIRNVPATDQALSEFPENMDSSGMLRAPAPVIPVRFFITKNRNGPTGESNIVKWNRATNTYTSLAG